MKADTQSYEVRFNGKPVGRVSVPRSASKRDVELAAMSLPEVQKRLGDVTVKGFSVVEEGVVNISA